MRQVEYTAIGPLGLGPKIQDTLRIFHPSLFGSCMGVERYLPENPFLRGTSALRRNTCVAALGEGYAREAEIYPSPSVPASHLPRESSQDREVRRASRLDVVPCSSPKAPFYPHAGPIPFQRPQSYKGDGIWSSRTRTAQLQKEGQFAAKVYTTQAGTFAGSIYPA